MSMSQKDISRKPSDDSIKEAKLRHSSSNKSLRDIHSSSPTKEDLPKSGEIKTQQILQGVANIAGDILGKNNERSSDQPESRHEMEERIRREVRAEMEGQLKAGRGMEESDKRLMEARDAFKDAKISFLEAEKSLREANDLKAAKQENREDAKDRYQAAKFLRARMDDYSEKDMKKASDYAQKERINTDKSIKDIGDKIKDIGKKKQETQKDKKVAENYSKDGNLSPETQGSWKKTGEVLGKTIGVHGQTEKVLEEAKKFAEEAKETWAKARNEWDTALGVEEVSTMTGLSLETKWEMLGHKEQIQKKYQSKYEDIGNKHAKELQGLRTTHDSQMSKISKWNKIKRNKMEDEYSENRSAMVNKHNREEKVLHQQKAEELQQSYRAFEQKEQKPTPLMETIFEDPWSSKDLPEVPQQQPSIEKISKPIEVPKSKEITIQSLLDRQNSSQFGNKITDNLSFMKTKQGSDTYPVQYQAKDYHAQIIEGNSSMNYAFVRYNVLVNKLQLYFTDDPAASDYASRNDSFLLDRSPKNPYEIRMILAKNAASSYTETPTESTSLHAETLKTFSESPVEQSKELPQTSQKKENASKAQDISKEAKEEAEFNYKRAEGLYRRKKYKDALSYCEEAHKRNPYDAKICEGMGDIYAKLPPEYSFQRPDYRKAEKFYSKAIDAGIVDANLYNKRGTMYHEREYYDKALADFDKAIELEPNDAVFYYNKGNALRNLKNAATSGSGYFSSIFQLAASKIDCTKEALECYKKAVELDPKNRDFQRAEKKAARLFFEEKLAQFSESSSEGTTEQQPQYIELEISPSKLNSDFKDSWIESLDKQIKDYSDQIKNLEEKGRQKRQSLRDKEKEEIKNIELKYGKKIWKYGQKEKELAIVHKKYPYRSPKQKEIDADIEKVKKDLIAPEKKRDAIAKWEKMSAQDRKYLVELEERVQSKDDDVLAKAIVELDQSLVSGPLRIGMYRQRRNRISQLNKEEKAEIERRVKEIRKADLEKRELTDSKKAIAVLMDRLYDKGVFG